MRLTAVNLGQGLAGLGYRQRSRAAEGPGGSHLREVHARRARVGDLRCRVSASPSAAPSSKRTRERSGPRTTLAAGRASRSRCRSARRRRCRRASKSSHAPSAALSHERADAGRGTGRRRAADPPLRARRAGNGRLDRVRGRDREAGPGRGRHAQAGPRRPRPRPAGWGRRGFHPRRARLVADPHHRALRTRRRDRQDRSAGCGSRRLSDQAVRSGRAAGESPGGAAAADAGRRHRQAVRPVRRRRG